METSMPAVSEAQLAVIQQKLALDAKKRNGINWFYWIAALSIINTGIFLIGGSITFIFGLGITQVIDGFAFAMVQEMGSAYNFLRYIAVVIDLVIAGVFFLFGFLGNKNFRWIIVVGMLVYAVDALLCIVFQDYLSALFHLWALFGIWGGWSALKKLRKLEEQGEVESIEAIQQRMPVVKQEMPSAGKIVFWIFLGVMAVSLLVVVIFVLVNS